MEGTALLKIGDFSKLSRISVRMLRHYDEIGLLRPVYVDRFTDYRYYDRKPASHCRAHHRAQGHGLPAGGDRTALLALYDDKDALDAHLAAQQQTVGAACRRTPRSAFV